MPSVIVSTQIGVDVVEIGTASFTEGIGRLSTRFRYEDAYLARRDAFQIEPGLKLSDAAHSLQGVPMSFEDSSPDQWGQILLKKQREALALATDQMRRLSEVDLLLGVSDATRQGALRFQQDESGPYLAADGQVPRLFDLAELLSAADAVADEDDDDWQALKVLLNAGSSALGGARAKAAIVDHDNLCLAKFPMTIDRHNVMVWEMTALDLAEKAGIAVPPHRLVDVDGRGVLLVQRFDRRAGRRIGYISARTLMQHREQISGAPDYVSMATALRAFSSDPVTDLRALWRQVAYMALINNTDNHLRNHGFLQDGKGWTNAPAFDLNPDPDTGNYRSTAIAGSSQRRNTLEGLAKLAPYCGVNDQASRDILGDVHGAVSTWREVAAGNGATEKEIKKFEGAFTGLNLEVEKYLSV